MMINSNDLHFSVPRIVRMFSLKREIKIKT